MMKFFFRSLAIAAAQIALVSEAIAAPQIRPEFQNAVARVRAESEVPMLLPTEIPIDKPFEVRFRKLLPNTYEAYLAPADGCFGYCFLGSLEAESMGGRFYSPGDYDEAEALYNSWNGAPPDWSPEAPERVSLADGIAGYFVPYYCGGGICNQAVVIWDDGGYRFEVGLRKGKRDAVVRMANSAIRNMGR